LTAVDALPFNFTNLDVYFDDDLPTNRIQYANWHGREVRKPVNKPWIFEDDLKDITAEDWEEQYPGRTHVTVTNHHSLKGFYNDKAVRWSRTQTCWVYGNNKPVEFPTESPDDSNNEGAVTAILERTQQTLETATSVLVEFLSLECSKFILTYR
jgi:hypothetical protein